MVVIIGDNRKAKKGKKDKIEENQIRSAPHMGTRWSEVFRTSWRESQSLLNWSLMPDSAGTNGDEQGKKGKDNKFLDVDFEVYSFNTGLNGLLIR